MKYCLGTVQFGMNYGIQENGQPQKEKIYQMLTYAIQHGISCFDTASAYGEAENILGGYVKAFSDQNHKIQLVSKLHPDAFSRYPASTWSKIAEKNAKESLKKLGVTKFAAYLFHNAAYIYNADAVSALSIVAEKGLADTIGVSVYTPDEAMKALTYSQVGAIQVPYNVFDRRLDKCGFFEKAKEKGVTIFARSSLLQGLILLEPNNLPDKVQFAHDYLVSFLNICKEFDIPVLNAAIGYVTQKESIDYVVFGADNLSQLEEYISLEEKKIPEDIIREIDFVFDNVEEKLLNPSLWN